MKAARIVARRKIEIVDVPEPEIAPGPAGMLKVRMELACVCGSDIPYFDLDHQEAYPLAVGLSMHECIGTVMESTSPRFAPGDFVMALPAQFHCGLCEVFLAREDQAVVLPRDAVPASHILMTQPLGTAIWACEKLGNILGQDVVVVGEGPMGLMISHLLSNLGARSVIGLDRFDYRLEAARRMKATHTVNVTRQDPAAAVSEITGGAMADLVVEAVGHQEDTVDMCLDLLKRLGTLLHFGVPDEPVHPNFPLRKLMIRNATLIGSVLPVPVASFALARDMIVQGRIDMSPLISHTLPFDRIQEAFELYADRRDGALKVLLDYTGHADTRSA